MMAKVENIIFPLLCIEGCVATQFVSQELLDGLKMENVSIEAFIRIWHNLGAIGISNVQERALGK